jgi:hypothetical protein
VNGGFFKIGGDFDGDPLGVLKIGLNWYSGSSLPRGAVGWNQVRGLFRIDRLSTAWKIQTPLGVFPIDGLNQGLRSDSLVFYTDKFGGIVPRGAGAYLRIENDRILEIINHSDIEHSDSEERISEPVIAVGKKSNFPVKDLKPNDPVLILHEFDGWDNRRFNHSGWDDMEYIVGGAPVLIQAGNPVTDYTAEKVEHTFVTKKHPRTALCVLSDEAWVFVVVDGRRPKYSIGMTLAELTVYLIEMGCQDALNLDGGGSSTIFYEDKVRNIPADPLGERPVSDAILVLEKEGP